MPASERAVELALAAAQAAADKKADDIVIIDVADQLVITDAFLVASAPNERQVQAIVDAIEEALLALPEKAKPVRREGEGLPQRRGDECEDVSRPAARKDDEIIGALRQ